MRLKICITIAVLLLSSLGWARTVKGIECENQQNWTSFAIVDVYRADGSLAHNYSTAQLSCANHILLRLHENGIVTCYGVWASDSDRPKGKSIDTMAWVRLRLKKNGQVVATTETNKIYGSVKIEMNCKITKVEVN